MYVYCHLLSFAFMFLFQDFLSRVFYHILFFGMFSIICLPYVVLPPNFPIRPLHETVFFIRMYIYYLMKSVSSIIFRHFIQFFSCFKHKKRLNGKMQNAFLLSLFYKTTSYSKSNTHPPPCPWYCGVEVLFLAWRMAFLLTGTSSSMRAFITKNRGVQRECPFGAGPQAIFMMRGTPVHLAQSSTGLRTNVVSEDILYRIPDISLDNICSSNGVDSMAVSKPSMSKPSPMFFVQYKQYLAPL